MLVGLVLISHTSFCWHRVLQSALSAAAAMLLPLRSMTTAQDSTADDTRASRSSVSASASGAKLGPRAARAWLRESPIRRAALGSRRPRQSTGRAAARTRRRGLTHAEAQVRTLKSVVFEHTVVWWCLCCDTLIISNAYIQICLRTLARTRAVAPHGARPRPFSAPRPPPLP